MIRKNLDYLKLLVEKSELWVTKTESTGSSKGTNSTGKEDTRLKKICLQESLDIVIGGGSSGSCNSLKVITSFTFIIISILTICYLNSIFRF